MIFERLFQKWGLLRRPEHHGSAGWASASRDLMLPKHAVLSLGAFLIGEQNGRPVALPRAETLKHGLIVGGSGTGKSRGYFIPNAFHSRGTSLVCTDPKSELWRLTSGTRERAVRYAPADPDASSGFNWIPLCREPRTAELCARALVESGNTQGTEQAWLDTEAAFLSGVFAHAATMEFPTPLTAYRLFTRQPVESLIEVLLHSPSEAAREQGMVFSQTNERMRGSIVPVVAARLQFLRDPAVARFTSAELTAPDFSVLRRSPTALYWCLRESDIARLRPLTALFFSVLLESLASGDEQGSGVPVTMLLDEFANVGTIPNFETTISLARGRGVALWLGIQSLGQLEARYGKANARTIVSNCGAKVALSGLDVDSAEYFSRALGEATVEGRSSSRHGTLSPTYGETESEHGRRLMTADEVRRIPSDKAIVLAGNRRPLLLTKHWHDEPSVAAQTSSLGKARGETIEPVPAESPPEMPSELRAEEPLRKSDRSVRAAEERRNGRTGRR